MNDNVIIKNVLSGRKDDYAMIMDRYHNELFHYVYNVVHNVETTEDLMQEIFLKIYKNLKKFNPDKASFRTWMYRIAHNYVYSYFKSKRYKETLTTEFEEYDEASEENIEQDVIREEKLNQILNVMPNILTEKHQKIMLLHFFSGLTVKEISETLDIPDKTIYKAIQSSIEKIKEEVA